MLLKVLLILVICETSAQTKYWVNQHDTLALKTLKDLQIAPSICSDWAGACSYELAENIITEYKSELGSLRKVRALTPLSLPTDQSQLTFALEQIEANVLIERGLNGEGVKIGVIDGGFLGANKAPTLSHFFKKDLIASYKDYITPELKPYGGSIGLDDNHGTEVWELIGGYHPKKYIQYGLATYATYYLARTDHGGFERKIEEDYLLQAMEDMAKEGVKLFNVSLGYTNGFDQKSDDYTPGDVDGESTVFTQAINHAAKEKGLLIIIAAGNDGNTSWRTLSIPADAQYALTVGSSKFKVWDKINYSSIGPDSLDFMKPNISVYSTLGTSYSAPIITGVAACIWQHDPSLSNFEVMEIIEKAGNFYPYGNNYLGYGVPTCPNILKILNGKEDEVARPNEIITDKNSLKFKEELKGKTVVLFHKKSEITVDHRLVLKPHKNVIKIDRPEGIVQTSVLIEKSVVEVIWQD